MNTTRPAFSFHERTSTALPGAPLRDRPLPHPGLAAPWARAARRFAYRVVPGLRFWPPNSPQTSQGLLLHPDEVAARAVEGAPGARGATSCPNDSTIGETRMQIRAPVDLGAVMQDQRPLVGREIGRIDRVLSSPGHTTP